MPENIFARARLSPVGGTDLRMLRVGNEFDLRIELVDDNGNGLPPGVIPNDAEAEAWFDHFGGDKGRDDGMFTYIRLASGDPNVAILRCTVQKTGAGDIMGTFFDASDDATGPVIVIHPAQVTSQIVTIRTALEASQGQPNDRGVLIGIDLNNMPPDRRVFVIYSIDGPFGWADFYDSMNKARANAEANRTAYAGFSGAANLDAQRGARWLWRRDPNFAGLFTLRAQIFEGNDLISVAERQLDASRIFITPLESA